MKISRFTANAVHEYIDFDLRLNKDVNFIAGLNGAGKTTALNLMVALLTPSLEELCKLKFSIAEIILLDSFGEEVWIRSEQHGDKLYLYTSLVEDDRVVIDIPDGGLFIDKSSLIKYRSSVVFKAISKIPSPMFLSLNRRFTKDSSLDSLKTKYEIMLAGLQPSPADEMQFDNSIEEVLNLISKKSAELKDRQAAEDKSLRNKIIFDSFSFSGDFHNETFPDRKTVSALNSKRVKIKKALINLDFMGEEFELLFDEFFEKLSSITISAVEALGVNEEARRSNSRSTSRNSANFRSKDSDLIPPPKVYESKKYSFEESQKVIATWFVNSHQLSKINRLILMIEEYEANRAKIYAPLEKFTVLVNSFLVQTEKKIIVTKKGEIKIFVAGAERSLSILSSGERQILIMLAHLSLNDALPKDGVFIVDEPELSLHLEWQEMFLEAVQAAGPDLQVILATHSPAIIGGRIDYYIPMNGGI